VDGLLHITEMSWTRINHPSNVVKVGDKIDVMVLRYDQERNRISLGLKQILPDPWEEVRDHFKVGQTVAGTVTRVVPFGAFVRLETGIEGIIPNAEMPGGRGQRAQDVLSTGESVQVKIVSIRAPERRMTLSLRQVQQAQERRELKEYMQRQQESSRVTIGDLVGDVFSEAEAAESETAAEGEREESAEEAATQAVATGEGETEASQPEPEDAAETESKESPAADEGPGSEPTEEQAEAETEEEAQEE
jgi:ribosomal protein S1